MFNGLNKKIFSRVLRKAVRTVSITEPINLQSESVFAIWKNAVHEKSSVLMDFYLFSKKHDKGAFH
jgi:hypothetical protein